MFSKKEFQTLVDDDRLDKAMAMIDAAVDEGEKKAGKHELADLYFERGKLYWKLGDKGMAISDYRRAVSLDATSPAAQALEMAREVMDFYNHDLYNP